ncbi:unnamed protein product [Acanthosepion pharaonis]|uniref:Uncharacterized protein n=1 Tax=Acanthosepion pharaonis TaxID=158019 RepID=A0A812ALJ9_ACAPH|nr:unnamed protein product [Sepia pharaonis]
MKKTDRGGTIPYWLGSVQLVAGDSCPMRSENLSHQRERPLALRSTPMECFFYWFVYFYEELFPLSLSFLFFSSPLSNFTHLQCCDFKSTFSILTIFHISFEFSFIICGMLSFLQLLFFPFFIYFSFEFLLTISFNFLKIFVISFIASIFIRLFYSFLFKSLFPFSSLWIF